jgi:DNA polymerase-1
MVLPAGFPLEHPMTIAFDTETHLFSNGCMAPPIVCLQECFSGQMSKIHTRKELQSVAHGILTDCVQGETLVGQNTAYDMTVLAAAYPELFPLIFEAYASGNVQCTRTRDRLIDMARGRTGPQTRQRSYYSMDTIIERRRLGIKVDKNNPWRLRYAELENVPLEDWPQDAIDYAKKDPMATLAIYENQHKDAMELPYVDPQGRFCFEQEAARQAGYDFALRLMTCWGMRSDAKRIEQLLQRTDLELTELIPLLVEAGVMREKGSKNTKAIQARIEAHFAQQGEDAPRTDKGAVKTDKETIEECDDPALKQLLRHKYLEKLRSTYVLKLAEGINGNIHANFHVLGADTGRTSSSNPNLQNQPRDGGVRECFVPRPGMVFVSADYDSQELRTLAQACLDICGFSKLAERFQEDPDFDPHSAFAASREGWTYEEAMTRKKNKDPLLKDRRQKAKAANFGFPGGLGVDTFVKYAKSGYNVIITKEESQETKDGYFTQWPEMHPFFDNAQKVAEVGQMSQLRSNRIRGGITFCNCANGYFQGLASDASKTAAFLVARACYAQPDSPLYGCRPVMLVHDEIVIEAPAERAHEAAMDLARIMIVAMGMWCPDVPARASPVVSRCWSKDAEQVWENGRLVPWDLPEEKENVA